MKGKMLIGTILTGIASVILIYSGIGIENMRNSKYKYEILEGDLSALKENKYQFAQTFSDNALISADKIENNFKLNNPKKYKEFSEFGFYNSINNLSIDTNNNDKLKVFLDKLIESNFQYYSLNYIDPYELYAIEIKGRYDYYYDNENSKYIINIAYMDGKDFKIKSFNIDYKEMFDKYNLQYIAPTRLLSTSLNDNILSLTQVISDGGVDTDGVESGKYVLLLEFNLDDGSQKVSTFKSENPINNILVDSDYFYIQTRDYKTDSYRVVKRVNKKTLEASNTILNRTKNIDSSIGTFEEYNNLNVAEKRFEYINIYTDISHFDGSQNYMGENISKYLGKADISILDSDNEMTYKNIDIVDEEDIVDELHISQVFTVDNTVISVYMIGNIYFTDADSYIRVMDLETGEVLLKIKGNNGYFNLSNVL